MDGMGIAIPPRGVSKLRFYQMINRVRASIKEFDPSYKLKERGIICAKEWKGIMPPPLDYIWGPGYTNMAKRLPEDKIPVLKAAAKATITIDHPIEDSELVKESFDIMRYAMHDIDIIGGMRRQKEAADFMRGVRS